MSMCFLFSLLLRWIICINYKKKVEKGKKLIHVQYITDKLEQNNDTCISCDNSSGFVWLTNHHSKKTL